jgi:potassium-transporting ATPase KdpC subunit
MKDALIALKLLLVMTLITGIAYPLLITGIARLCFANRAGGSLVVIGSKTVGSQLIAQAFRGDAYFWPRPSAVDYNPLPSGASNFGPTNSALKKVVNERRARLSGASGLDPAAFIPPDLLFASGSGLDPHITPEAARFQVDRVLRGRKLDAEQRNALIQLIDMHTEERDIGIFGEPRVNVLLLNIALDSLTGGLPK